MRIYDADPSLVERKVLDLNDCDLFGIAFRGSGGEGKLGFAVWQVTDAYTDEGRLVRLICSDAPNDPDEGELESPNDWVIDAQFIALDENDALRLNTLHQLDQNAKRILFREIRLRVLDQIPDYKELAYVD